MTDLLAAVGEVLLLWGHLETAMRERIAAIPRDRPEAPPKNASVLSEWRKAEEQTQAGRVLQWEELLADIAEGAAIRNCLAHGLSSASANPWGSTEAQVVCRLKDGSDRTLTLSELKQAGRTLHELRMRVQNLS